MKEVLVIVAHADDEVLGCGGTLIKHVDCGDVVHLLILAEGVSSRSVSSEEKDWTPQIEERNAAARAAALVMGCEPPVFHNYPNLRMADSPMLDVVKIIEAAITEIGPNIVYTHHGGDLNSDHRVVHEATITACRPLEGLSVTEIYALEVPSSTEWSSASVGEPFLPTRFVDISGQWDRKIEALGKYEIEMREFPHPRSVTYLEAQARRHGVCCHRQMAEGFVVLRQIA